MSEQTAAKHTWSGAGAHHFGSTATQESRMEALELDLDQTTGSVRDLRKALLADPSLKMQNTIAQVTTVLLAGCFAALPLFFALALQFILNESTGTTSLEKMMGWQTAYLLTTFILAGTRGYLSAAVIRRVTYRLDLGLATLADKARHGDVSMVVGRDAAEANHERVSKTAAWVTIQAPLDLQLYTCSAVFSIVYLSFCSWKLGSILIATLTVGGLLGFYIMRLGRLLSELEKQLSVVAGTGEDTQRQSFATEDAMSQVGSMSQKAMTAEDRKLAINDLRSLEGTYSAAHASTLFVQYFFIFNTTLFALYFGALKVIAERDRYGPEELMERLFYFIATLYAFLSSQSVMHELEEALPQTRVIAKLQRDHKLISSDLINMIQRKHLALHGFPKRLMLCGLACIAGMAAWLAYLVQQGGGFACQPLTLSCELIPTSRVGLKEIYADQAFSIGGGGCVISGNLQDYLEECAEKLVCAEIGDQPSNDQPRLGDPILADMKVECPFGHDNHAVVISDKGAIQGFIVGKQAMLEGNADPSTCTELQLAAKADKVAGEGRMHYKLTDSLALTLDSDYVLKTRDDVPQKLIQGGSPTERTVRMQYKDWSVAPTEFSTGFVRREVEQKCSAQKGKPEAAAESRRLAAEDTNSARRRVMKAKFARLPQKAFEAKLRVTIQFLEGKLEETLSLQLFQGSQCSDPSDTSCEHEAAFPISGLGEPTKSEGSVHTYEMSTPGKLPRFAVPCSPMSPSECFSTLSLLTSGRKAFKAAIAVVVLEDGIDDTVAGEEDPSVAAVFRMPAPHKCEGSESVGTFDCSVQIVPEPPAPSDSEDGIARSDDPLGAKLGKCEKRSPEKSTCIPDVLEWKGVAAPPAGSPYRDDRKFEYMKYNFDADSVTNGQAQWELWVFKETRSATRFAYRAFKACGCHDKSGSFELDPRYMASQQTSYRSYPRYCSKPTRQFLPWSMVGLRPSEMKEQCKSTATHEHGRLIYASLFDHNAGAVQDSYKMTGVLPMSSTLSKQAWKGTDEIVDCVRDIVSLLVLGGAVFDQDALRDDALGFNGQGLGAASSRKGDEVMRGRKRWFWDTHNVETPTYLWKIIHPLGKGGGLTTLAFWIPNTEEATRKNLKSFVVSISHLQKLIDTHGRLSDKVALKEKFEELTGDVDRETPGDFDKWMQNVKSCRKAGPSEGWMREFCRMKSTDMPNCGLLIADEEDWCWKLHNTGPKVARKFKIASDARCKEFKAEKIKILHDMANKPTRKIAAATSACEKAVKRVCIETLCPIYTEIKKGDVQNCPKICEETATTMFKTGQIECDDDEAFGDCIDRHNKRLIDDGRRPELEALMREHLVKCVCVTWKEDKKQESICYQGSMALAKGQKWCQFKKTPSWLGLLKKSEKGTAHFPKPTCNQIEN